MSGREHTLKIDFIVKFFIYIYIGWERQKKIIEKKLGFRNDFLFSKNFLKIEKSPNLKKLQNQKK